MKCEICKERNSKVLMIYISGGNISLCLECSLSLCSQYFNFDEEEIDRLINILKEEDEALK